MAEHKLKEALREVHTNVPSTVKRANVSGKRKRAMLIAIAHAKARKRGEPHPKNR